MTSKQEQIDALYVRLMDAESKILHLSEVWVDAFRKADADNTALRADIVALKNENEGLRAERNPVEARMDALEADQKLLEKAYGAVMRVSLSELGERFAKVEDRLAKHDERFDTQSELVLRRHGMTNERIDKVAEIIGERVSGLVDQLEALAQKAGSVEAEHSEQLEQHSRDIGRLLHLIFDEKPTPAFPTGGADTAEVAAEAVLPVPQRGDRVRLEGLPDRATLRDGWYDVAGATEWGVQIENGFDGYGTKRLYNVERSHVKEVRHADHT